MSSPHAPVKWAICLAVQLTASFSNFFKIHCINLVDFCFWICGSIPVQKIEACYGPAYSVSKRTALTRMYLICTQQPHQKYINGYQLIAKHSSLSHRIKLLKLRTRHIKHSLYTYSKAIILQFSCNNTFLGRTRTCSYINSDRNNAQYALVWWLRAGTRKNVKWTDIALAYVHCKYMCSITRKCSYLGWSFTNYS